jgi:hypothetical protein
VVLSTGAQKECNGHPRRESRLGTEERPRHSLASDDCGVNSGDVLARGCEWGLPLMTWLLSLKWLHSRGSVGWAEEAELGDGPELEPSDLDAVYRL